MYNCGSNTYYISYEKIVLQRDSITILHLFILSQNSLNTTYFLTSKHFNEKPICTFCLLRQTQYSILNANRGLSKPQSNNSQKGKALSSSLKLKPSADLFMLSALQCICAYIIWFKKEGWKYFCRFFSLFCLIIINLKQTNKLK